MNLKKKIIIILLAFIVLPVTVYAAFTVPQGGTGVGTITGIIKGNGTSRFTAATPGSDYIDALTNGSGTTANGTAVDLGGALTNDAFIQANGGYDFFIANLKRGFAVGSGSYDPTISTSRGFLGYNGEVGETYGWLGDNGLRGNGTIVSVDDRNNIILIGTPIQSAEIRLFDNTTSSHAGGDVWTLQDTSTGRGQWQTAVSSITGTANRIDVSPATGNPVVDISASYVGQTSITTLGTIGTGVWNGTTIGVAKGGTNITSYAVGDILYASGSTTLSKLADVATGNALISGGVTTAPSWGKIGLTTHVSGTLPVTNGGTGTATAFTSGSVVFAGTSGVYSQDNSNFFWDSTNKRIKLAGTGSHRIEMPTNFAIGSSGISAAGTSAMALGDGNPNASGNYSMALGYGPASAGVQSLAFGLFASSGGLNAVAIGPIANASASGAIAIGVNSIANIANAISIGNAAQATTASSAAMGAGLTLADNEFAWGTANGLNSVSAIRLTGYSDTQARSLATINTYWADTADATRKGGIKLFAQDAGSAITGREILRGESSGSAAKIGFLGASAVVRPSSTTDLRQSLIDLGLYTTGGASPLDLNGGALKIGAVTNDTGLAHGNSTPSATNVTNITSSTPNNATYSRVGNIITVYGTITVTNTLAVASQVDVSLPIASNLGAATDLNGNATMDSTASVNLYIKGDAANDRASIYFTSAGVGQTSTIYYSFQYKVI